MSTTSALQVRDLGVSYADKIVLDGVDLVAQPERRIALVGENGTGKSTLLRAVAGDLPATAVISGGIERSDDVGFLPQEPPFTDSDTIAEVLTTALRPLREAVAAVERLATADLTDPIIAGEYAGVLEYAVDHDAWDAERRSIEAAARLGLGAIRPHRRIGTLSGGQRTRLALALLMTTRPQCLLLDEPTNHLDDAAIDVLAEFLRSSSGVVLSPATTEYSSMMSRPT